MSCQPELLVTFISATVMKLTLQVGVAAALGTYAGHRGWLRRDLFVGLSIVVPLTWLVLYRWLP